MTSNTGGAAYLSTDNVVRFSDLGHFLRELEGNLGRGKALVRTKRNLQPKSVLSVRIEAPGISWGVDADAVVVFTKNGVAGLELSNFEAGVRSKLARLGEEAARANDGEAQGERTVVAENPLQERGHEADQSETGEARFAEDDDRTSELLVSGDIPDALASPANTNPTSFEDLSVEARPDDIENTAAELLFDDRSMPEAALGGPTGKVPLTRTETIPGNQIEAWRNETPDGDETAAGIDLEQQQRMDNAPTPPLVEALRSSTAAPPKNPSETSDYASDLRPPSLRDTASSPPPVVAEAALMSLPPAARATREAAASRAGEQSPLHDKSLSLKRTTGSGVLRLSNAADLLGLYLAEIRHGFLTTLGGPDGAIGDAVKLKIAGFRVIALDCKVLARVGDWVTLKIDDPEPVASALKDAQDAWTEAIDQVREGALATETPPPGRPSTKAAENPAQATSPESPRPRAAEPVGEPPRAPALPAPPAPSLTAPARPDAKAAAQDLVLGKPARDDRRTPVPKLVESSREDKRTPIPKLVESSREDKRTPIPKVADPPLKDMGPKANDPAVSPKDEAPPASPPKLQGDVIVFQTAPDLRREIETNIKNGGLFVEAAPLPLRTHRTLKVSVGNAPIPIRIEADVVFASGGRVGFSVTNLAEVKLALEKGLDTVATASALQGPTATADLDVQLSSDEGSTLLPGFASKITRPPTTAELFSLHSKRPKDSSELAHASAIQVIEFLSRNRGRGVLTAKNGEEKRIIYFHEGSVAYVESHPFDEATALGRILVASKKINESALREALERAKQQKRPLGRMLVSLGAITKKILVDALREQTRAKIDAILAWSTGSLEWGAWREPPGDADLVLTKGLGIIARYVRARFETMGLSDLEGMLGKSMGRIVAATDAIDNLGLLLGLQQKELRFMELSFGGDRTIADAVTGSPIGRLASLRLLGAALSVGMLQFRDGRSITHVGPGRSKAEKEQSAYFQIKRDLKDRLLLMKDMNHFEVLGVHWSAHYRAYRAAYEKAKAELNVARPPLRDAPPEAQEMAKEILKRLEKAYSTLSDENERIAYRKQFFDKTERQYSADMLVKQGELALMRGDRVAAMEALETAVELDPSQRNRSLLTTAREGKG